MKPVI